MRWSWGSEWGCEGVTPVKVFLAISGLKNDTVGKNIPAKINALSLTTRKMPVKKYVGKIGKLQRNVKK